jgi:LacI family transcriptional regulator
MKVKHVESKPVKVGLILHKNQSWSRRVLPGLAAYAREKTNWELSLCGDTPREEVLMNFDAVIGVLYAKQFEESVKWLEESGKPTVNISGAEPPECFPTVTHDNQAIGRLAAEHLIELGLEHFACMGIEQLEHTLDRRKGFTDTVIKAGFRMPLIIQDKVNHMNLNEILSPHNMPLGIFAVNDQRARHIEHYVHSKTQRKIPSEIALIGCDNDFMECELSSVPLSSIELDYEKVGRTAGELLTRLLQGESVPSRTFIPPVGVVQRRSSDYLLIDDNMVRRVLDQLRTQYFETLSTEELARKQGLTPRHLQRRFKAATGKKLQEALLEIRLQKAAALLRDTPKTVSEIAMDTGFSDLNRFPAYFRRQYGATPRAYRNQMSKT